MRKYKMGFETNLNWIQDFSQFFGLIERVRY